MSSLHLRRVAPDDYAVIDEGHPVGRIRRAAERTGEVWMWNVTVSIPGAGQGTADGLEAAKTAFRAFWISFKAAIGEARLRQALQEAQDARERFSR